MEPADRGVQMDALRAVMERLISHPKDVGARKSAAEIYFKLGQREKGFEFALSAFALDPTDVGYALDCAYNLLRAGRRADAVRISDMISRSVIEDPFHCDTLGTILTHCQLPERAFPCFQRACQLVPNSPQFLFNLASVQRMLGNMEEAEVGLDRATQIAPDYGAAFLARSQLRRQTRERNHIGELTSALERASSDGDRISIGFALAKEMEDLGLYQQSFSHLSVAARLQRAHLKYDPSADIRLMKMLRGVGRAFASYKADVSCAHARPIFVMGLPRSGTTLVDRVIASVPGVQSAGEVNVLGGLVWRRAWRNGRSEDTAQAVAEIVRTAAPEIGLEYMESLEREFDGPFIDKTPGNYLFAGLIAAGLPNARMVCLRRNPMDSCYAMYKTLFSATYPFTNDLSELADYFVEWDQLIRYWETNLGSAWLTVSYEELVLRPEPTMRRIVSHCGLEWDEACLQFHKLAAPVTSASAGQVSRPLHADSIGLWRRYETELSELAGALRRAGISFDT